MTPAAAAPIAKTAVAAPAQVRSALDALIGDKKVQDRVGYLQSRWADEHEYEDFKDYAAEIEKSVNGHGNAAIKFLKATKRPFGAVVEVDGFRYQVGVNSTSIYFKRA